MGDGTPWTLNNLTCTQHNVEVDNLDTGNKETVTVNEMAEVGNANMDTHALYLNGTKFQVVQANVVSNSLYLRAGNLGMCFCLNNQSKVIGLYDTNAKQNDGNNQNPGNCNAACEGLSEKLRSVGY